MAFLFSDRNISLHDAGPDVEFIPDDHVGYLLSTSHKGCRDEKGPNSERNRKLRFEKPDRNGGPEIGFSDHG